VAGDYVEVYAGGTGGITTVTTGTGSDLTYFEMSRIQ
jgi:hypothetical protein